MSKKKHKVTSKTVEEKIDEEVEKILENESREDLDAKIKEVAAEKIEEKINEVVQKHVEPASEEVKSEENIPLVKNLRQFKSNFHLCWSGPCKVVTLIIVPVYLIIAAELLLCHYRKYCIAPESLVSALIFMVIMLILGMLLFFLLFTKLPKTAVIFWIILSMPLAILLFIFSAQYMGLILLGIVLVILLFQMINRGY